MPSTPRKAALNGQLAKVLGSPWPAAIVVYVVGLIGIGCALPFVTFDWPTLAKMGEAPWWAWIGGLLGAVFVMGMLMFAQKLGAGVFTGVSVTAAVVASLALDHFGLVGFKEHAINLWRVAGGLLMIGGLALIAAF